MCQAVDDFSSFLGHNDSNYGILYGSLPYYIKTLSAKYGVSMSISHVTVTQFLNIPNVSPQKFFGPLKEKGPELGMVIINLLWPMVYVNRKL